MKLKRKKPFNAKRASIEHLTENGWTCGDVESRIPHTFITRDLFGFADIFAMSPGKGVMLVQSTGGTSTSNYHAHVRKIKAEARHAIALASGIRIQLHHWQVVRNQKQRELFILEITPTEPNDRPTHD